MNLFPIIYFIVIFSSLNMSLQTVIREHNLMIEPDHVQRSLNQLALAQYQYYAKQITGGVEAEFAPDLATLKTEGFLPVWQEDPHPDNPGLDRYSVDATDLENLTLKYKADNQHDAGRIAARFGSVARLDPIDPGTVEISYITPIDASLMGIFLPRDASLAMIGGPLRTKDLIVEGDLTVTGASRLEDVLTVEGVSTLKDTLRVEADTYSRFTYMEGEAVVLGNLNVAGSHTRMNAATIYGAATINAPTTINGVTTINGATTINADTTLERTEINNILTLNDRAQFNDRLTVEMRAYFKDDVIFEGADLKIADQWFVGEGVMHEAHDTYRSCRRFLIQSRCRN